MPKIISPIENLCENASQIILIANRLGILMAGKIYIRTTLGGTLGENELKERKERSWGIQI